MGKVFSLWNCRSKAASFLTWVFRCKHKLHITAPKTKWQSWKEERGSLPGRTQASLYMAALLHKHMELHKRNCFMQTVPLGKRVKTLTCVYMCMCERANKVWNNFHISWNHFHSFITGEKGTEQFLSKTILSAAYVQWNGQAGLRRNSVSRTRSTLTQCS